jgi:hypothetical protein
VGSRIVTIASLLTVAFGLEVFAGNLLSGAFGANLLIAFALAAFYGALYLLWIPFVGAALSLIIILMSIVISRFKHLRRATAAALIIAAVLAYPLTIAVQHALRYQN